MRDEKGQEQQVMLLLLPPPPLLLTPSQATKVCVGGDFMACVTPQGEMCKRSQCCCCCCC
jgi:hypothetical protein